MGAEGADLPQHPLKNKGWFLTNPLPEIPRFFRIAFFWCKQNYSKDDHSFGLPHSRLQEKPTCSQVGFLWLMQNSG